MRFVHPFLWPFVGILFTVLLPEPVISAERIYLFYGPFKFSLSVEALEIYATEGRITSEFAFYANQFDEPTLLKLRQMLQKRYYLNQVTLYRFTYTPMVEEILKKKDGADYQYSSKSEWALCDSWSFNFSSYPSKRLDFY